jgi:predicted lactoylglutathione lyase
MKVYDFAMYRIVDGRITDGHSLTSRLCVIKYRAAPALPATSDRCTMISDVVMRAENVEVLVCLSRDSRAQVDELVAKAL